MRDHKATKAELLEFAKEHAWQRASNYIGEDYSHMVVICGRHRDSETYQESNFEVALEMLGGEGKHVEVARSSHWAVGWVEVLLVNPKSLKKLAIAYSIVKSLEDYPVLDDSDYSDRQYKKYEEWAESEKEYTSRAVIKHFGLKKSETLVGLVYQLHMEHQLHCGEDSSLHISEHRKPDSRDLKDLRSAMERVSDQSIAEGHTWKQSRIFQKIYLQLKGVERG